MKVALVTGAYKGLGLEWCKFLAENDYHVVLTARDIAKAEDAKNLIQSELIFPLALDVTNEIELNHASTIIEDKFGKLDLLINNAGINPKDFTDKSKMAKAFSLEYLDADVMLEVLKINSIAPLLTVKHFKKLLLKSDQALVINISSWLGSVSNLSFGGHYGYVGSKNLLNVLNKSMALELKPEGIKSVNVNPGWVQTDMGGKKATFTPAQSVENIYMNVIEKIKEIETGSFVNFDGTLHPW